MANKVEKCRGGDQVNRAIKCGLEVAIEIERNGCDFDIVGECHRVHPAKKTKIIVGKPPSLS